MTSDCICPEVQPHGSNPGLDIPEELREKVEAAWDLSVKQIPKTVEDAEYWRLSAERQEALAAAYGELDEAVGVSADRVLNLLWIDARNRAADKAREFRDRVDAYEKNGER